MYGVPYRWGCTIVVYRKDRLQRFKDLTLTDWDDLLDPRLANRVAFMDSPRELVGIALKTLGLRYKLVRGGGEKMRRLPAGCAPPGLPARVPGQSRQQQGSRASLCGWRRRCDCWELR